MYLKKTVTILWLLLWSITSVFASEQIDFNVSTTQMQIGERLQVEIVVDTGEIWSQDISIELPWQENFRIFSQSQWYNFESINGVTKSQSVYTLDLIPYSAGTFTLGPVVVKAGDKRIEDDKTISIEIWDIIWRLPSEDDLNPIKDKNAQDKVKEISKPKLPIALLWALGGIFFLVFYLLIVLFLKKHQKQGTNKKILPLEENTLKKQLLKYFEDLWDNIDTLTSQKFFRKYNKGIRKIFESEWIPNALTATLKELQREEKFMKHDLLNTFKKSYKHEYSSEEKQKVTRKKYLDKIIIFLEKM